MDLLVFGVIAISTYGFCYYQNNKLQITDLKINLNNKEKVKVLQLSDLHSKQFGKNNNILAQCIYKENPDIIVATGDLIDSNMKNIDKVVDFLGDINKRIPVFYIPGNNEMRCFRLDEILTKLKLKKVHVLINELNTIKVKSTIVNILGLVEKRVDNGELFYNKVNSKYKINESDKLLKRLEKMNGIKLVLSHYPENFEANKDTSYSKYKFDIMFSGHAHGGQFILPFVGGLFAPGQGILPKYYSGIYGDKNKLVVSRGLGNSGFPVRLFNKPNIVIVEIL